MKEETACSKSNKMIIWWRTLQTKVNIILIYLFNPNSSLSSLSWNVISRITFRIPYPTSLLSFMALLLQIKFSMCINFMWIENWKIHTLWSFQGITTALSSQALFNNECFIHQEARVSKFFHILPVPGSKFYYKSLGLPHLHFQMLKSLKSRIDAAGCFSIITFQIKVKQVSLFGFLFYTTLQ